MSTALVQRLQAEPKSEIVNKLVRFKQAALRHKENAKHAGQMMLGTTLAAAGGAAAGVLAVKMPVIPRTQAPTDLAIGGVLSTLAALGVFDDNDVHVNAFASGLIGAGMAKLTQQALTRQ